MLMIVVLVVAIAAGYVNINIEFLLWHNIIDCSDLLSMVVNLPFDVNSSYWGLCLQLMVYLYLQV